MIEEKIKKIFDNNCIIRNEFKVVNGLTTEWVLVNPVELVQAVTKLVEEERENLIKTLEQTLPDCSGCTYDRDEGTHQSMSKQHFREFYLTEDKEAKNG